ncbi:surface-associated interspersed protein 1.1 (SURFIN 1.1) [Plasmodium sp. gorilla clade G2]|uniref:surface-associated interspersed protein 1.1 (SURFIN 1.1) n=1 Tax=Plasmodium sp. gorilla clade G2 TaxID=880535 RepID=UPI000D211547|nr:surface-associated interspersed protein 1.1 (SURFIN 1.1) [Plasmodium sp. gorilla clade G2]SOV10278.1 surface-associated interspersed protein 1.1 (SURFIN 1.1) [Plasmodium sp. gorilla clade G2]
MQNIGIVNNILVELENKIVKRNGPIEEWKKKFLDEVSKKIGNSLKKEDAKECKKNCRNFNYWMDDKEEDFVSKKFIVNEYITSSVWQNEFEKAIISTLKKEAESCTRNRKKYPKKIRNIMGELEDYIDDINDYKVKLKNKKCTSDEYKKYTTWLKDKENYFTGHKEWNLLQSGRYGWYIVKNLKRSLDDMFKNKIACIEDIPEVQEEVVHPVSRRNIHGVGLNSSNGGAAAYEYSERSFPSYIHEDKSSYTQLSSNPVEWSSNNHVSVSESNVDPTKYEASKGRINRFPISLYYKDLTANTPSFPPKDFPYIVAWILGAIIAGALFVFGRTQKKQKAITLRTDEVVKEKIKVVNDTKEKKIPVRIENEHMKKNFFWKWITIIEIHFLIIEDIRKDEWEMNKEDFLSICIKEFMNEKNRKCLYNEDDDFNSTDVMIKGQTFLWNKWMERHKYILDKWKEEESFKYLKNDWKREEEEYMKKIYKELLISLRGDTYNMSQRQKIIWKRWIAKHPYRIREKIIDQWFHKLFEEINKNNIISDEIIDVLLNDYIESDKNCEYIYNMSEKKEKLKLILWIRIYMCVLEEEEKYKLQREKEMFIDTYIDKLKDKKKYGEEEYDERNKELIKILNEMKKMEILNTDDEIRKKWKHQDWFKQMRKEWIREENRYLNEINEEIIRNYNMELKRYMFEKHWEDIKLKWIDNIDGDHIDGDHIDGDHIDGDHIYGDHIFDDNIHNGWSPIIKCFERDDEEGRKYIQKKRHYFTNELYDIECIQKNTLQSDEVKEKFNIKTIIDIHMVIIEDIENDEWKKDKGDFLHICFEEFIKRKESKEEGQNKIIINNKEENNVLNISDNNIIYILQNTWSEWFKRHTYILDQWKKEEWFKDLKNDWKREEYEYMKKIYKDLLLSLRGDTYNMSQRQKIIWRRWIAKHLYHINDDTVKKWFKEILEQLDKGNIIDLSYIENEINKLNEENEENEKNLLNQHQIIYNKKKILTTILWIQIHMMVLEESKKDACKKSKEIFLDTCIDELKKEEKEKKKKLHSHEKTKEIIKIVEDMKKLNNLDIDEHRSTEWKKKKWFKEMKKDWVYIRDRYLLDLEERHKYDQYECEELIDVSSLDVQKDISKWNWENIQFKWIDYENEKDWLKGADVDEYIYEDIKGAMNGNVDEYTYEDIKGYMNGNVDEYTYEDIKGDINYDVNEYTYEDIKGAMNGNVDEYTYEDIKGYINDDVDEYIYEDIKGTMNDDVNEYIYEDIKGYINDDADEYIRDNMEKNANTNVHKDHIKKYKECDYFFKIENPLIWQTVIEIQLKIMEESKKEKWEKNKYDFLDICIEEYIKNENKDNSRNILEDDILSMNKNIMWDTFIETHRYILEKWKREEWFHNLKKEWEDEILNYLNSSENRNDESNKNCNESNTNFMIEKEKIVFRKWINKHTEELKDCYEDEKNPFLEEEEVKKKKKLILTAWIQIHMMILERFKEDEFLTTKELFIDAYIEEFKKDKHPNKYNNKIINMLEIIKKNIHHTNLNNEMNEWKNETWFKQWKDDWIKEENGNVFWLAQKRKERCTGKKYEEGEKKYEQKDKYLNEYNIGKCYINIHKNLLKKYLKYMNFKWIDDDNEIDWLRIVGNDQKEKQNKKKKYR